MYKRIKSLSSIHIVLLLLFTAAFILRFVNLGYSDYQGDETKALYRPEPSQSLADFLSSQRKGPVQFLVTGAVGLIDPDYTNQFLVRLPFAAAAFLAAFFFYKFAGIRFGRKVAIYASFFFITNGIIVGLSRIAQYQSFVFLFNVLALYLLAYANRSERRRIPLLYFSMLVWVLAILAHQFDGIFIAPFYLFLLYEWYSKTTLPKSTKIKHILLAVSIGVLIVLLFYAPVLFSASEETIEYWAGRLYESDLKRVSNSIVTFRLYQPVYVIYLYLVLLLLGVLSVIFIILIRKLPDHPLLIKYSNIIENPPFLDSLIVLIWFGFPLIFLEGLIRHPGTHIYTYLIPGFIIMGLGCCVIEGFAARFLSNKYLRTAFIGVSAVIALFIFIQSYFIFVDHRFEYPWQNERFFTWSFHSPNQYMRTNLELPLFGFPYNRGWEEIGSFIRNGPGAVTYNSNEKDQISGFYVQANKKDPQNVYFIFIQYPQNLQSVTSIETVFQKHDPIFTHSKDGRIIAAIFLSRQEDAHIWKKYQK